MSALIRVGLAWAANVVALLLAEGFTDGLRIEPEWRVITAGAVFGLINWSVKPVLRKLAAPMIILTLGIALFAVNLLAVYLASEISTGFELDDFDAAIAATFWLWLVNAILHVVLAVHARRHDQQRVKGPPSPRASTPSRRRR